MRELRNYGIYNLPKGSRPVYAVLSGGGWYSLYDLDFGRRLPPRFEVTPDGRVFNWHKVEMPWTSDDLIDTGEKRSGLKP